MKTKKLLLFPVLFGFVLAGCGNEKQEKSFDDNSNTQQNNNGSNSNGSNNNGSNNSYVSDKQKVINFLMTFGTTSSHYVDTGTGTGLGYSPSEDEFIVYSTVVSSSTTSTGLYTFSYNSNIGYGMHLIESGSTTTFHSWNYVHISNHTFSSLDVSKVETNQYSSSAYDSLASIILDTAQMAVNNASYFLYSHDLPYIY